MDIIQNKTQKSTAKKSIEDTEMENLEKKRKELRQWKTLMEGYILQWMDKA